MTEKKSWADTGEDKIKTMENPIKEAPGLIAGNEVDPALKAELEKHAGEVARKAGAGNAPLDPVRYTEAMVLPIMRASFLGIFHSFPAVPPAVMLQILARGTGFILANSMQGNLTGMLQLRNLLREEFENGLKMVKVSEKVTDVPPNPLNSALDEAIRKNGGRG